MHKKIRALSGGQRQRVALAAALLGSPDLLVLDEPATGLDPAQRLQLRSLLSEHGRHGTVVLSTHHTVGGRRVLPTRDRHAARPCALRRDAGRTRPTRRRVGCGSTTTRAAVRTAWITADGTVRAIGDPPNGAELVEPTIDDGYLLIATAGDAMTSARCSCDPVRSGARRALVAVEARRSLEAPWVWLGIALSTWFAYSARTDFAAGGYAGCWRRSAGWRAALFVLAVNTGGAITRRAAPWLPTLPSTATNAPSADCSASGRPSSSPCCSRCRVAVQRVEGGMWIADRPVGGNDAVFSIVEMLQPPMLFAVAVTAGVALGRARRAPCDRRHRRRARDRRDRRRLLGVAVDAGRVGHADPDAADRSAVGCRVRRRPTLRRRGCCPLPMRTSRGGVGSWSISRWRVGTSCISSVSRSASPASPFAVGTVGRPRSDRGCGCRRSSRSHRHTDRSRRERDVATLAWATPTRRAMRWRPFAAVTTGIGACRARAGRRGAPPTADPLVLVVALLVGCRCTHARRSRPRARRGGPTRFRSSRRPPGRLARSRHTRRPLSLGMVAGRADMVSHGPRRLAGARRWDRSPSPRTSSSHGGRPDLAASVAAAAPAGWVVIGSPRRASARGDALARVGSIARGRCPLVAAVVARRRNDVEQLISRN